jgi:hypothetical protein
MSFDPAVRDGMNAALQCIREFVPLGLRYLESSLNLIEVREPVLAL